MINKKDISVSVCMITYNHERFITQAIESVMMQEANFGYELVIGEDCSTDRTRQLVVKSQKKYPHKIKLILNKKNLGMTPNFIQTLKACRGKYVALLEGDDYWTSAYKLQKQVDFLNEHPDFTICFHNARNLNEETGDSSGLFFKEKKKEVWTLEDLLKGNFIPTLTCLFRNQLFEEFPKWYYCAFPADWPLHIFNAKHGKIKYLDEVMAVYRTHHGGITRAGPIRNYERYITTFGNIESYIAPQYKSIVAQSISKFYFELSKLYFQKSELTKAKRSIIKCIKKSPFNPAISKKQLLVLVIRLYIPKSYYIINFFKV